MSVKIFYPNKNGKIEFTKEELEKLLDEVYREGQRHCNCGRPWTYSTPYRSLNATNTSESNIREVLDISYCNHDNKITGMEAGTDASVATTTANTASPDVYHIKELTKEECEKLGEKLTQIFNDPFLYSF